MAATLSVENLASCPAQTPGRIEWLQRLLAVEAWLDDRASRRAVYGLDTRALADLGLSQADADRIHDAA
jgi:uncharacterized protein YjiS (DUF1127 family)